MVRGDSALTSEIEEVFHLFRTRGNIRCGLPVAGLVLLRLCRRHLRCIRCVFLRKKCGLVRSAILVQFGLDGCTDEIEGFVNLGVELILRKTVREFHLDRGVERLAAVFGISRDFLGITCVEFEHGLGSFLFEYK